MALLADYATGRIPTAPGLIVSAHLEACSACRDHVSAAEEAEGAALEASEPAPLRDDALIRALAAIDDSHRRPALADTVAAKLGDVRVPAAAARLGLKRRRFLAPGLWAASVKVDDADGWRAFLLRVPAGMKVPPHRHRGSELIAVLAGAFKDGHLYRAGDFAANLADGDHDLQATDDGPCACLIAIQGRVQWRGWARMITPLVGI